MKKIINVCVCFFVCLSLFVSPTKAASYTSGIKYFITLSNSSNTVINQTTSNVWGTSSSITASSNWQYCTVLLDDVMTFKQNEVYGIYFRLAFGGSSVLSYIMSVEAKIGYSDWKQIAFDGTFEDWVILNGVLTNSGVDADFIEFRYILKPNTYIPNLWYVLDYLSIDSTTSVTVQDEISNINTSVNTLYSSVGTLQNDFVNLNNDISEGADAVVGAIGVVSSGIGALGDTIESGIGTIFGGITTLISNSGSIKDMVRSIADSVASLDLNFLNWWNEYISNYTYVLMALNNINSSIQTYCGQIIEDLGIINSSMYTCTNAVTSTMNAMNRDIQEQMIAQGNGINSSIKTMETAIVTKLDDTLVVDDKTGIHNNDTVTEDLDSSINDYDNVEQGLVTDFNDSLDSLDTDSASNIYNQNDFVRTTTFISTNMQNIYESNDFIGGFIDLTLLLGLIFIVIGIGVK